MLDTRESLIAQRVRKGLVKIQCGQSFWLWFWLWLWLWLWLKLLVAWLCLKLLVAWLWSKLLPVAVVEAVGLVVFKAAGSLAASNLVAVVVGKAGGCGYGENCWRPGCGCGQSCWYHHLDQKTWEWVIEGFPSIGRKGLDLVTGAANGRLCITGT
jgi:hypothetical protein